MDSKPQNSLFTCLALAELGLSQERILEILPVHETTIASACDAHQALRDSQPSAKEICELAAGLREQHDSIVIPLLAATYHANKANGLSYPELLIVCVRAYRSTLAANETRLPPAVIDEFLSRYIETGLIKIESGADSIRIRPSETGDIAERMLIGRDLIMEGADAPFVHEMTSLPRQVVDTFYLEITGKRPGRGPKKTALVNYYDGPAARIETAYVLHNYLSLKKGGFGFLQALIGAARGHRRTFGAKSLLNFTLIAELVMKYNPRGQIDLKLCRHCMTYQISMRAITTQSTGALIRCAGCTVLQSPGRFSTSDAQHFQPQPETPRQIAQH